MGILITVFVVFGVLTFVIIISGINIYNGLVSLKNQVDRAWSNIDVILKQRFDEISQLIEVLEQFVAYEKSILSQLVEARTRYGSASSVDDKIKASSEISMALKGVFAIGENYPQLQSNNNFMQIQTRISGLENSLADRREGYNETVTNFNTRIEQFPDIFFARLLGYTARTLFQVNESEKVRPNLKMKIPGVST